MISGLAGAGADGLGTRATGYWMVGLGALDTLLFDDALLPATVGRGWCKLLVDGATAPVFMFGRE
jgi:hypothetical protein